MMKTFAKGIVRMRVLIIILSFLLLLPSAFGILSTRINYDILAYLPSDLETMQGQDILLEEFGNGAYSIFVCKGMQQKEVTALREKVEQVDHVDKVLWYDSVMDLATPKEILPKEIYDVFYSDGGEGTLMFIFFDTTTSADETLQAVDDIRALANKDCFLAGMSSLVQDTKLLILREMPMYIAIAGILTAIVLALTQDSFLIPLFMLLNIGMAILYNLGSNVVRGEISFLTLALVAILQLGVTMDYSIFLHESFKEQKEKEADKKKAMANAIEATIVSITGSSLTTIAGFIALCFMSFTLGLDLGIVMAKGVVFGVITCVTILPSFLLVFDGAIEKTSHKPLKLPTETLTRFILKHYRLFAILMLLLWIPAAYGNSKYEVYYKLDESLPQDMGCVVANKELEAFQMRTVSMLLVSSDLSSKETRNLIRDVNAVDGVNFCIGLDSLVGSMIPDSIVPQEAKELLESENWKMLMFSSHYERATDECNAQCDEVSAVIKSYDPGAMLVGEAACTKDLIRITDHDFDVVSTVSIGAIFILVLLVLQSFSFPFILVAVIELAIFINMAISYFTGQTLPFIASVCIGTIQLGATVDYAILMTTRYKLERISGKSKKEASSIALETSIHSVMTSGLGLFAATVGVGIYSSADLIASICMLLGRGAIISMLTVILMLPSMFMLFDGLIIRTTRGMKCCVGRAQDGKND